MTIEIWAQRAVWSGNIEVTVADRQHDRTSIAKPLEFEKVEEGNYCEPTMRMNSHSAQMMMDELWRCGLRPTEGSGSAGSLAATERHLKDMQAIAFGLIRKNGVQI